MRLIGLAVGLTVSLVLAPLATEAQQAAKTARIGYLSINLTANPRGLEAFRQGLRDRGYVEGRNVVIEYRDAEGKLERLPALAADLVALRLDVIVPNGAAATQAASHATKTIAVVGVAMGDPVGSGFAVSLARPGGNITGLATFDSLKIIGKNLELLKEAVPGISRVAVLRNPSNPAHRAVAQEVEAAARRLAVQLQPLEASGPNELGGAFAAMTRVRAGALLVVPDAIFFGYRTQLVDLAAKHRIPTMYGQTEFPEAGGLMSYGSNISDQFRRAAYFVDKILKGAKPGDLPVEQPTKFELVINLKTAKALGLTIPQTLLLRADQLIE
jgi:putative tryptophan/tyrosine transport system substrate-binding protein